MDIIIIYYYLLLFIIIHYYLLLLLFNLSQFFTWILHFQHFEGSILSYNLSNVTVNVNVNIIANG